MVIYTLPVENRVKFTTTKGKKYVGISLNAEDGDKVGYRYEHSYNSHSSVFRIINAKFVRYLPKNKCLIKREDCKGKSRVPINQVFKEQEKEESK